MSDFSIDEYFGESMQARFDYAFFHKGFLYASPMLSKSAIRLYLMDLLHASPQNGRVIDLSIKYLIQEMKMSRTRIYEAQKELKLLDLIKVNPTGIYLPHLTYTHALLGQTQAAKESRRQKRTESHRPHLHCDIQMSDFNKDEFLGYPMQTRLEFAFFHKGFLYASHKLSRSAMQVYMGYSLNMNYMTGKVRDLSARYFVRQLKMTKSRAYDAKKEVKSFGLVIDDPDDPSMLILPLVTALSRQHSKSEQRKEVERAKKAITLDSSVTETVEELLTRWQQRRA